jgi:peptidoglycan/LPS O-acetylase OafA/YrhL
VAPRDQSTRAKSLASPPLRPDFSFVQPPAAPAQSPERLWALDAFRGLCAFTVFLCHWHLWSNLAPQGTTQRFVRSYGDTAYDWFVKLTWPTGGHHPAVICFFVLSGFCIHYPFALRARRGETPDWSSYFRRRFRRIMPVYWVGTIAGLVFVAAQTLHPADLTLLRFHATWEPLGVGLRFLGLEGLYPEEVIAGNYILTTVAAEIFMYAVYPLIHGFAVRGSWATLGLGFLGLHLLGVILLQWVTPFWVFNSILFLGLYWYAGAYAAHLYLEGRTALHPAWTLAAWTGFLGLKQLDHFYGLNLLKQAAWGLVCTCAILTVLHTQGRHSAWPAHWLIRGLRYLGGISYSLYAVHTPAIMLATWLLVTFDPTAGYFSQLAAAFALSALAVLATHYRIERRCYPAIVSAVRS